MKKPVVYNAIRNNLKVVSYVLIALVWIFALAPQQGMLYSDLELMFRNIGWLVPIAVTEWLVVWRSYHVKA